MPKGIYKRRENTMVGKNPNSRNGWKKGENHPGMIGKNHSQKTKIKMSETQFNNPIRYWLGKKRPDMSKWSKEMWKNPNHIVNSKDYRQKISDRMSTTAYKLLNGDRLYNSRGNCGWYKIGNKEHFFRSSWEVNYARYLEWLFSNNEILKWEYEPETFWFKDIMRGARSYKPDFKIYNNNGTFEYHEVKGWMDPGSKTKIKRMAKYYPSAKLIIIDDSSYKNIKKFERMFPESIFICKKK